MQLRLAVHPVPIWLLSSIVCQHWPVLTAVFHSSRTCCYRQKHADEDQDAEQAGVDDAEDDDDHKPIIKRRGKPKFMF